MNFGVEIRHKPTGRAVTLFGKQAVADFLAGVDASQWEGYACLGELPAPTPVTTGEFALAAEPVVEVVTTAYTFGELVAVGRASGCPLYGDKDMPWSFSVDGLAITHENDECYIVATLNPGHFHPGDLLVIINGMPHIEEGGEHAPAPTPAPVAEDRADTDLIVGDTFADKTVSVGDSGKGDSYLPADTEGEQE